MIFWWGENSCNPQDAGFIYYSGFPLNIASNTDQILTVWQKEQWKYDSYEHDFLMGWFS